MSKFTDLKYLNKLILLILNWQMISCWLETVFVCDVINDIFLWVRKKMFKIIAKEKIFIWSNQTSNSLDHQHQPIDMSHEWRALDFRILDFSILPVLDVMFRRWSRNWIWCEIYLRSNKSERHNSDIYA